MRLLKNQFKNFVKPYHEELSSIACIISPKTFSFESSKKLLDLCLLTG